MVKIDANAYLPCMKCDAWVPSYAEEIHEVECHQLGVSKFSHSYIKGLSLHAEAIIISSSESEDNSKSNDDDSSKKKKQSARKGGDDSQCETKKKDKTSSADVSKNKFEEPEWLKKIFPSFHYQIAILNERDLIRCNISAYTPIVLEYDCNSSAFLAVPVENVRIGHIVLHKRGCKEFFPSLKSTAMVVVNRIARVEVAKEVIFSPYKELNDKERQLAEKQLKHQLFSTCPLGSEFTLNIGSKVHLHTLKRSDQVFRVASFVLPDNNIDKSVCEDLNERFQDVSINSNNSSVFDKDSTIPSQLVTLDEYKCSETSALASDLSKLQLSSDETNAAYVTIDECNESSSCDSARDVDFGIFTSTPNKKSNSVLQKSLLATTAREKILSSVRFNDAENQWKTIPEYSEEWVRVGKETKVTIQCKSQASDSFNEEKKDISEDVYYKGHAYGLLLKIMENKFRKAETVGNPLLGGWSGVLLYGPPGTGKTLMVKQAAAEMNVPVITLTLADMKSRSSGDDSIYQKFRFACERAPAILFMDEVDSLCPAGDHRSLNKNDVLAAVIRGIQILQESLKPVLLIGATSRPEAVAAKLQSPGRLDKQLIVPLPDPQQRAFILQKILSLQRHNLSQKEICEIAKQAYGFSGADLTVLLKCSWINAIERIEKTTGSREQAINLILSKEDLYAGLKEVVPTMMRQNYSTITEVRWDDIWGYEALKLKLQTIINQHLEKPEVYLLKGLLLYGPPGCSKTMFVRALVSETNFSFFPLKCSNLLSKYVGETEKSLSKVFVRAEQAAPSIIFMDEIDSLCGERSGSSLLVSELLSLMSTTKHKGNIWIIGATNRPAAVDEALLQPGHLEQIIHVDLPDFSSRSEMWKNMLNEVPLKGEVDFTKLSESTEGYSGAEITGLYQEAASTALRIMESSKKKEQDQDVVEKENPCIPFLTEDLILKTIKSLPPRTPSSLLQTISLFTNQRKR